MFSLRLALQDNEWEKFKVDVNQKIRTYFEYFFYEETKKKKYIKVMFENFDKIFENVKELYCKQKRLLENKIEEIKQTDYAKNSPLLEDREKWKKDIEIVARNRLYVTVLEDCSDLKEKLIVLKKERKQIEKMLNLKSYLLDKQKNELHHQEYQILKTSLQNNIKCKAKILIKIHYQQILANTFANEAYVCRSAIYHVVNSQSRKPTQISEQTLLGSSLQQVGFKILHGRELATKNTQEEVAYLTAKYGQRIFNLVFSGQEQYVDDSQLLQSTKGIVGNIYKIFDYLKSEKLKKNLYKQLSENELILLNFQAKVVSVIKVNSQIPDVEKPTLTKEMLGGFLGEEEKYFYRLLLNL